ncbi:hypothetical protein Hanom_Chr00s214276g01841521 [Helianthus anomalus]
MCGSSEDKSEIALILTLFYLFRKNNVKSGGRLIMQHVMAFIAERRNVTSTNRPLSRLLSVMCLMLMQNYYRVGSFIGSRLYIPTG